MEGVILEIWTDPDRRRGLVTKSDILTDVFFRRPLVKRVPPNFEIAVPSIVKRLPLDSKKSLRYCQHTSQ